MLPDPRPDLPPLPEGWSQYLPFVTAVARWFLAAAGSAGFMWAQTVTASQLEQGVGLLMVAASLGWSALQKYRAGQALRVAAGNPQGQTPPQLPA